MHSPQFAWSTLHVPSPANNTVCCDLSAQQLPVCCACLCTLEICRHVANASGVSWNAGDLDFTGGQMVLTLKLISMAMCFQDANSRKEEVRRVMVCWEYSCASCICAYHQRAILPSEALTVGN
eukprot:GHRR01024452.1.p1 GENE.GHRR01024452.1~~GHRR01024452.1.p1  ORF type:complete len:123 (+),score=26.14 GHRR01024452.1:190-558(+)